MSSLKCQINPFGFQALYAEFGNYFDGVFENERTFLFFGAEAALFFRLATVGITGVSPAHVTVAELDAMLGYGLKIRRTHGHYGGLSLDWPPGMVLRLSEPEAAE